MKFRIVETPHGRYRLQFKKWFTWLDCFREGKQVTVYQSIDEAERKIKLFLSELGHFKVVKEIETDEP